MKDDNFVCAVVSCTHSLGELVRSRLLCALLFFISHAICRLLTFYLSFGRKDSDRFSVYDFCDISNTISNGGETRLKICHYVIVVAVRLRLKNGKNKNKMEQTKSLLLFCFEYFCRCWCAYFITCMVRFIGIYAPNFEQFFCSWWNNSENCLRKNW